MKRLLSLCAVAAVAVALLPMSSAAAADLRTGRQIYRTYCVSCHGINGRGEGGAAIYLTPKPRDFTACALMRMYKDADLFKAIKLGGPAALVSYNMPPWEAILSDAQIGDVLAYERSFCAGK